MSGQVWVTNSLGGYMYSDRLSSVLRFQVQPLTKFRQFANVKDAAVQGKHKGDIFHWNFYSDLAVQGTTIVETSTMPETNFTVSQGTMTIGESGNSVPFTEKLDDLSLQPVTEIINRALKNDARKAFDLMAYNQFNATPLRIVPTGGTSTVAITLTTNGTATLTNNVALGKEHIKTIADLMKERNIPPFLGDDYICIAHPTTLRKFKNDMEPVRQYTETGFAQILNGEAGRFENIRFVEQNFIPKAAWANGASNWAFFFGDDTVAEGVVVPEEIRGKIPTDYGRSRGVAWYYVGGMGLVQSAAANARVLRWDSAA